MIGRISSQNNVNSEQPVLFVMVFLTIYLISIHGR